MDPSHGPLDQGFTSELDITPETRVSLEASARWAKILAFLGFVSLALTFIGFIISLSVTGGAVDFISLIISLVITVVFYIFPLVYTYRFSSHLEAGMASDDPVNLRASFSNLKSLFKFSGITTGILLSLFGLILFFGLIVEFISI